MTMTVVVVAAAILLHFAGAAFTAGKSVAYQIQPVSHVNTCDSSTFMTSPTIESAEEDRYESTNGARTTRCQLGLLRGVDPAVDDGYSNEIETTKEGLAWLDQPGLMWTAATRDAEELGVSVTDYIEKVNARISAFGSSGTVYGREDMLRYLDCYLTVNGAILFFLGGRNLGKSTILQSLANNYNLNSKNNNESDENFLVLYVDGRLSPGRLDVALANGIAQLAADMIMETPQSIDWVQEMRLGIQLGFDRAIDFAMSKIVIDKRKREATKYLRRTLEYIFLFVLDPILEDGARVCQSFISNFINMAADQDAFPVLIIDEADEVLGIGNDRKPDFVTNNLLTSLISYTKHSINVMLVSSVHAYPYRLQQAGFNLLNVYNYIFAGEITPKEMWKLLRSATYKEGDEQGKLMIGMGHHLAELCLAAYGGHFWIVQRAIQGLSLGQENAVVSSFLPDLSPNIMRCLDTNAASRPLLEAMAKDGIAHVKILCPVAELISKEDVGGLVDKDDPCIGISQSKLRDLMTLLDDALIPCSQCARLTIAKVLLTR